MHIPDAMLQGSICPITAALSAAAIAVAAWKAFFAKNKPGPSRFAAVTALIFAAQMINFPVTPGTSGHLLGGVLAAVLLGIPFGILSMSTVVITQSLLFSDGGISVLGANVLNMAIIGAGLGGLIELYLRKISVAKSGRIFSLGLAAWLSVMLAALACSIQLALAGAASFREVALAMFGVHALIGIGEGLITLAICFLLGRQGLSNTANKPALVPLFGVGAIALILSPFASGLPDGLEWVAAKYNFLQESAAGFAGVLADYRVASIANPAVSTFLAGLAGVAVTFAFAWFLAWLISRDRLTLKNSI